MKMNRWLLLGILVFLFSACTPTGPADAGKEQEVALTEMPKEGEDTSEPDSQPDSGDDEKEAGPEEDAAAEDESQQTNPSEEGGQEGQGDGEVSTDPEVTELPEMSVTDYQALGVNELGHIMVVMYHGIKDNPPYHRLKEDFIKDLTFMYDHNYRPISLSDYLSGHIDIEAGMTPIVLTFDDGLPTTFSLTKGDEGLAVTEDTAVALMEGFALDHPDFGKEASFYIHSSIRNFKGDGHDKSNLKWLVDHGYEIGNHSDTHANFKKLGKEALVKEVGSVFLFVDGLLPEYEIIGMTYPFGARPSDDLLYVISEGGTYKGYDFDLDVAFREGPSGIFYPPMHKKFSPYNAPRVRGSEGEVQDLWWFFEYYEANPEKRYISDGNPETLVIPESMGDQLGEDVLNQLEVIVY